MRTLAAAVLLLLAGSLPAQDDARFRELLQKLDDDAIDVRATAAAALMELGSTALPSLRRAAGEAGNELRHRLEEIIRKIQDRERLSTLLPPATRITLDARDRPLREVFEMLAKQVATALDFSAVPEDAKVTVTLDRVPFWKALDQICRASGRVSAFVEVDHVIITAEPYFAMPGKITDLFAVTLERIELTSEGTFGQQDHFEGFTATIRASWEKGARPVHGTARIVELVDEQGNELIIDGEDVPQVAASIAPDCIRMDFPLESQRGPGPQATKLSKLKVEIEFDFPLKYAQLKVDISSGKSPLTADAPEFSVQVRQLLRQEGALVASIVMIPHGPLEGDITAETVTLRDKAGKEYTASVSEGTQTNENETPYVLSFQGLSEKVELSEIVIRVPTDVHHERLDLEFKDLSLK